MFHDDVMTWKCFPLWGPFWRESIYNPLSTSDSKHNSGALMVSFQLASACSCTNKQVIGDLRYNTMMRTWCNYNNICARQIPHKYVVYTITYFSTNQFGKLPSINCVWRSIQYHVAKSHSKHILMLTRRFRSKPWSVHWECPLRGIFQCFLE